MAVELGVAYVSLLPSTSKLAAGVAAEFGKVETDAKAASTRISAALASGIKPLDVEVGKPVIPTPANPTLDALPAPEVEAPTLPSADTGGFFSSLKSAMGPIGAIAGGVLGTALIGGVKAAMEVEAGRDLLAAQLGLGEKESAKLGKVAGSLYSNAYGESLTEVNDALRTVLLNVPGYQDAGHAKLERFTAKILDQAAITGEAPASIAAAVGQLVKTQMVDSSSEALSLITKGYETGLNKNEDFLDTINEYSVQFQKLGIDGPRALDLIRQGMEGGARDSDIVADAFKELSIRVVDDSETTRHAFEALGFDADVMRDRMAKGGEEAASGVEMILDRLRAIESPAKRSAIAVEIFGTQSEDMGNALFGIDFATPTRRLNDFRGATARAGDTLADNASTKITVWWRTVKTKIVDFIGTVAIPALNDLADYINTKVGPSFRRALEFAKDGEWKKAWGEIKPVVQDTWDWISSHISQWARKLWVVLKPTMEWLGGKMGGVIHDAIIDAIPGVDASDPTKPRAPYVPGGPRPAPTFRDVPESGGATRTPSGTTNYGGAGGESGRGVTHDNRVYIDKMAVHDERDFQRRRQGRQRNAALTGVGN